MPFLTNSPIAGVLDSSDQRQSLANGRLRLTPTSLKRSALSCAESPICDGISVDHLFESGTKQLQREKFPTLSFNPEIHDQILTRILALGALSAQHLYKAEDLLELLKIPRLAAVLAGVRPATIFNGDVREQEALSELCIFLSRSVQVELKLIPIDAHRAILVNQDQIRNAYLNADDSVLQVTFAFSKDQLTKLITHPEAIEFLEHYELAAEKGILPGLLAQPAISEAVHNEIVQMANEAIYDPLAPPATHSRLARLIESPISALFFVAGNNAETTERCLRSYFQMLRLFCHVPPAIVIVEDSKPPELNKKVALYKHLAAQYKIKIHFFGKEQKREFVTLLTAQGNCPLSAEELGVKYFVPDRITTQRNFVSLLSHLFGEGGYMTVDTDSFSGITMPTSSRTGIRREVTDFVRRYNHDALVETVSTFHSIFGITAERVIDIRDISRYDAIRMLAKDNILRDRLTAEMFWNHAESTLFASPMSTDGLYPADAHVRIPVDTLGIHGKYLGEELQGVKRKGIPEDPNLSSTKERKIAVVYSGAQINTPGSASRAFATFLDSGIISTIKGFQPRVFLHAGGSSQVTSHSYHSTVTCISVARAATPHTLLAGDGLDSFKLGFSMRTQDEREPLIVSLDLALDHLREREKGPLQYSSLTEEEARQLMRRLIHECAISCALTYDRPLLACGNFAEHLAKYWCVLHLFIDTAFQQHDQERLSSYTNLLTGLEEIYPGIFSYDWRAISSNCPTPQIVKKRDDRINYTGTIHTLKLPIQIILCQILHKDRARLAASLEKIRTEVEEAMQFAPTLYEAVGAMKKTGTAQIFDVISG